MPDVNCCSLCGGAPLIPVADTRRSRLEISIRNEFISSRLARKPDRGEMKDLTDFMHGFPAPLLACPGCGVLIRGESAVREAQTYEEDPNDPSFMLHVLPRYVEAFRQKEPAYRELLRPRAEVLELGPHLGAFLEAAEDWSWRPTGVDIGKDTAAFCNQRGLLVRRNTLGDARFASGQFDAVFIWNCFEQLADPSATLLSAWRILQPGGLLVLRVPNAMFYESFAHALRRPGQDGFVAHALAYNNLLGFPYLYGYTPEALDHLVTRYGFAFVRGFNSELVTMPFADVTARIACEQARISEQVARWSAQTTAASQRLTGPWLEMVYRKLSEDDWSRRLFRSPRDQIRRLRRRIDLHFLPRAA